jgi:hypothetical protein
VAHDDRRARATNRREGAHDDINIICAPDTFFSWMTVGHARLPELGRQVAAHG